MEAATKRLSDGAARLGLDRATDYQLEGNGTVLHEFWCGSLAGTGRFVVCFVLNDFVLCGNSHELVASLARSFLTAGAAPESASLKRGQICGTVNTERLQGMMHELQAQLDPGRQHSPVAIAAMGAVDTWVRSTSRVFEVSIPTDCGESVAALVPTLMAPETWAKAGLQRPRRADTKQSEDVRKVPRSRFYFEKIVFESAPPGGFPIDFSISKDEIAFDDRKRRVISVDLCFAPNTSASPELIDAVAQKAERHFGWRFAALTTAAAKRGGKKTSATTTLNFVRVTGDSPGPHPRSKLGLFRALDNVLDHFDAGAPGRSSSHLGIAKITDRVGFSLSQRSTDTGLGQVQLRGLLLTELRALGVQSLDFVSCTPWTSKTRTQLDYVFDLNFE